MTPSEEYVRRSFHGKLMDPFLHGWMDYITSEVFRVFGSSRVPKYIIVRVSNILFDNKDNMFDIMNLLNAELLESTRFYGGKYKKKQTDECIWEFIISDLKEKLLIQALEL